MNDSELITAIDPLVSDTKLTSNFKSPGCNDVGTEIIAAAYCCATANEYIDLAARFLQSVSAMKKISNKEFAADMVIVLNNIQLPHTIADQLKAATNTFLRHISEQPKFDHSSPNSTTDSSFEHDDNHDDTSEAGRSRRRRRSPPIVIFAIRKSIRSNRYQGSFIEDGIRLVRSPRHGKRRHTTGAKGQQASVPIPDGDVIQDDGGDYASDLPTSPVAADTEEGVDYASDLPIAPHSPSADQPMAPVADRVVQADDDGDCDSDEPTAPAADIADIVRLDLLRGARIVESTVLDLRSTALDKGLEAYMESVKPGLEEKACWKALQQLLKLYVSTVQALADVNSIEQLWSMEKRETEAKKELSRDPFICLTKEEEAAVEIAFSSKRDAVLVFDTERNITITGAILHCLKDGEWLNDEVIHIYLKLLKEREMREPQKFLKCHFYDALFHTLLVQEKYNFKVMESWSCAKRLGYCIFDCHMIFVPIHKTNHWVLVVVNMKDKKFEYLDSLPRTNKTGWDEEVLDENVMSELSTFFCGVKDEDGKDNDMRYWQKIIVEDLPKQKNGDDCGMFMLKYIDFYCRGLEFCFDQSHMRYFRRRTVKEILNMKAD